MATPLRTVLKNHLLDRVAGAQFAIPINGRSTWFAAPSRRLKLFNAVDPTAQPAAFVIQHRETYNQAHVGVPPRRYLDCGIWCYARTDSDSIIGDDYLDAMEDALEIALKPDDVVENKLTFGGLCYWCRIDRTDNMFIRDPGDIDGQALLVLPVRIFMP